VSHWPKQLHIFLKEAATIAVGKLGDCTFPPGSKSYTGSAGRNIAAGVEVEVDRRYNVLA